MLSTIKRKNDIINLNAKNKEFTHLSTTENNPIIPENTLTPSSSIYYSDSNTDSSSSLDIKSSYNTLNNKSNTNEADSNSASDETKIKNTVPPTMTKTINATSQQILDVVSSFINEADLFENISMELIDQNVAESRGTFTKDVDSLIKRYPGFANYKSYLKLFAGQNVYAKTKVVVDENNQLIPSFESLYVGIFPIPTSLINNKLKDNGPEFTNALEAQLN